MSRLLYGNLLYLAALPPGPKTSIFGRTDPRISLDPETDFDADFAVARQNPRQIGKTKLFSSEMFSPIFLGAKIETSEIV